MLHIENSETLIRLSVFFTALFIMFLLENLIPRRPKVKPILKRWVINFSLIFIGTVLVRVVLPIIPIEIARINELNNTGILNALNMNKAYPLLSFFIGFLILEVSIYFQHRVFHFVPILWRIHSVHHLDRDLDASTGNRFHPIEIFFSLILKIMVVYIIGISAFTVFVFEIMLNASSIFNHSNIKIHDKLESVLRRFIVTPDFHRIHHSVYLEESNTNFGFIFTFWDYLFNTKTDNPKEGQLNMPLGLKNFTDLSWISFNKVILFPFKNKYRQ